MLHPIIGTAATILLFAGTAYAQIVPGDSPNMGVGAAVAGSRGLGVISRPHTWEGYETERNYHETVKRIPDKKKLAKDKDPWRNIRQTPTPSSVDRHQPR
jgi:hypothetical protein